MKKASIEEHTRCYGNSEGEMKNSGWEVKKYFTEEVMFEWNL